MGNLRFRGLSAAVAGCLPVLCLLAACESKERGYAAQTDDVNCPRGDAPCTPRSGTDSEDAATPNLNAPSNTTAEAPVPSGSIAPLPSVSALPASCSLDVECDDGAYCNGAEQCIDGSCQPGTAVACDDSVPCTLDRCDELLADCAFMPVHAACTDAETPLCNPATGCSVVKCESNVDCDDGVACNGDEQCNTDIGSCEAGEPVVCDDEVDCTHDACSEVSGACEFERDNSLCDDGAWCNGAEVCTTTGCVHDTPPTLDDRIPCTRDLCDETNDEVHHIGNNVTLTITGVTDNFGRVSVAEEGGICSRPPCALTNRTCGSQVDLIAQTSHTNGYGFSGWSGAGCRGLDGCTIVLDDDVTVNAEFAPANVAFVTSTKMTGALGGLAGADAECQDRASAGGLEGTFKAWLGTSYSAAGEPFGEARGWVRSDGRPLADWVWGLEDGRLYYPLRLDEYGSVEEDAAVRTGEVSIGNSESRCQDWTEASSAYSAAGYNYALGTMFGYNLVEMPCDVNSALYCFQVDRTVVVRPIPDGGRVAFVTVADFLPGGGIEAADALCQEEATAAGLSGSYSALLATSTASAASRFDTSGWAWMRTDGIRITEYAEQMFTADHWDTAPNVSADGLTYFGNESAWSGGTSLTSVGTPEDTCQDWTSTAATGKGGYVSLTQVEGRQYSSLFTCGSPTIKLTCLQN